MRNEDVEERREQERQCGVRAIGKTCGASDVINAGCARYTCGPCDWDDNAECGMRQRRGRDQGQTRVYMRGNK